MEVQQMQHVGHSSDPVNIQFKNIDRKSVV